MMNTFVKNAEGSPASEEQTINLSDVLSDKFGESNAHDEVFLKTAEAQEVIWAGLSNIASFNPGEYLVERDRLIEGGSITKEIADNIPEVQIAIAKRLTSLASFNPGEYIEKRDLFVEDGIVTKESMDTLPEVRKALTQWLLELFDNTIIVPGESLPQQFFSACNKLEENNIIEKQELSQNPSLNLAIKKWIDNNPTTEFKNISQWFNSVCWWNF